MNDLERGTVTVFLSVFMFALLVVAGLVFDGGNILAARREASNVAESAARAGAQALDENATRSGSGTRLDGSAAVQRANDYLAAAGFDGTVTIDGQTVSVEVKLTQRLFILGVAGLANPTVIGRGSARAVRGVTQEGN